MEEKNVVNEEKLIKGASGLLMLFVTIGLLCAATALLVFACINMEQAEYSFGVPLLVISILIFIFAPFLFAGLKIVNPNEALVLTLFGKYYGTLKDAGYYFVNPFCSALNPAAESNRVAKSTTATEGSSVVSLNVGGLSPLSKRISLKAMTLNNEKQKVNDAEGNPIVIGVVVIWKVVNTAKAVFNVDNYTSFLSIQCDSTIRNIARLYPYDISEDGDEKSLRGSSQEVADKMQEELQGRVNVAGLEIIDVRITHLSYSQEIAAAMLQRQQASAIIAARQKIVEGAVGMVEMALDTLNKNEVVNLDEERKAAMVSNLLVVLCGNKDAQPIVNSGTIY